jgi:mediator of RNA polymerase II transcription subunit 6
MPDTNKTTASISLPSDRFFEEALAIHQQFGDQYMDLNPITGKPGDFHLSSTGRKGPAVNLSAANFKRGGVAITMPVLPALNTKVGGSDNPLAAKSAATGKETKSPRTPGGGGGGGMQKGKKRKSSKAAVTPS